MAIWLRAHALLGLIVLVTGVLLCPGPSRAVETAASDGDVDAVMREAVREVGAPGAAWVVVEKDGTVREGATGVDGHGSPFGPDSPVLVGSVSKPIAATVAVRLADQGTLDLDAPVVQVLPEFAGEDQRRAHVTLRHLLAHTGGLPFGADRLDVDDPARTPASVVAETADTPLEGDPGQTYRYSSLGYVVVAAVLERATGRSLGDLANETFPQAHLVTDPGSIPPGYRSPWSPVAQPAPRDGAGAGYGYLGGSARSLAEVGRAMLADPERLRRMTDVSPADGAVTGLGWRVSAAADGPVVWHTGTVPGSFTALFLEPEQGRVAAVTLPVSGVMDEERLYAAAHRLLDVAGGDVPTEIPPPTLRWGVLGGLGLVGVVACALLTRGRLMRVCGIVLALTPLALMIAAPPLLDVPLRYLWLWVPEVPVGVGLVLVAATITLVTGVVVRHGQAG
ncbi:serine hydrolase domain-containing protein [Mobilicoccus caccae]|uniref:Beta-lactamase-related domain-containing protein n=1 Tax=Mobilicoccus caccae TaxID=1859295 RepID=A0ABQ6ISP6_9MICO|nr:serine hydrolase domain-containing protein [Mobilicoccus caccae]GMA40958.1 hypothetical protein GCM10025883_30030 [Mobilicoccus caccae]